MKNVNFGLSTEIEHGVEQKEPSVALRGDVVLATWGEGDVLHQRLGQYARAVVNFPTDGVSMGNGVQSSCALVSRTAGTEVTRYGVEVHKSEDHDKLYSRVGPLLADRVAWNDPADNFSDGIQPSLAANDALIAVAVHRAPQSIHLNYHVGTIDVTDGAEKVTWSPAKNSKNPDGIFFALGNNPAVAIDATGRVVVVYENKNHNQLLLKIGQVQNSQITFGQEHDGPAGHDPAIALTDDGLVILVYDDNAGKVFHQVGTISGTTVQFAAGVEPFQFDQGRRSSVATYAGRSVQIHQSEDRNRLFYSNSLVTDRASWMRDRRATLGAKSLSQLALPASHDAGTYDVTNDPTGAAKAQDLSILGQLQNGIRYFDLRPRFDPESLHYQIYHDIEAGAETIIAVGPRIATVLADVATFAGDSAGRELVILKFSKYLDFDAPATQAGDPAAGDGPAGETASQAAIRRANARYRRLVSNIKDDMGSAVYSRPKRESRRLAKIPLNDYLATRTQVLVVCDGQFPIDNPDAQIQVYRDTTAPADPRGDLRVYDQYYSGILGYDALVEDQKGKFNGYRGAPDDLFLLSWTITPAPARGGGGDTVWKVSVDANKNLGRGIGTFGPNRHGKIVNLIFVNYVESARVTDVCLHLNGAALPPA